MPRPVLPPGPGRPKGCKNKATLKRADILPMVLGALKTVGGQKAFEEWAQGRFKKEFLKDIIGLIPKEDSLELKGNLTIRIKSNVKGNDGKSSS